MLFALICTDKPNSLDLRVKTRPEHVEYLKSLGEKIKFAGPFLGDDGKPNGSLVVIDTESRQAAEHVASHDPYSQAGLFAHVDIRAWNWTFNNPEAK